MKNISAIESGRALCAVRRKNAAIEKQGKAREPALLGHGPLDSVLGGGLPRGKLHELFAVKLADNTSAAGFAAMLASLVSEENAPLFWLREEAAEERGRLHAPGLMEIGIDPGRMVLVALPDPVALLRTAVDVVRCPSVGAAVIELWHSPRALDLTATRRLALAAEASGVTPLLLRVGAEPGSSAAQTRWSVHAAPSAGLEAEAPAWPALMVELLRQRGRPGGGYWHLEWDCDRTCFRGPALPEPVVSTASRRSMASGAWRQSG